MTEVPDFRFYYLANFERALDWLQVRYADLLNAQETQFLERFRILDRDSRALLVRLLMRRGPLFRESKLRYEELDSIDQAVQPLIELGWIDADPNVTACELARLYPKCSLVARFGFSSRLRKADLSEHLEAQCPHAQPASSWRVEDERIFNVTVSSVCEQLRWLFFGNFHQDWKEFVLADLGIFKYELLDLDANARAFQTRAHIDAFYALGGARQSMHDEAPLSQVRTLLPQAPLDHEWLEERRGRMQFELARAYERAEDFSSAFDLYSTCTYPGSRARQIRVLEKEKRANEALQLAQDSGEALLCEAERELIGRALRRLSPLSGVRTTRVRASVPVIDIDLASWDSVEQSAAEYLQSAAAPVFYVENILFNGLFGLWAWDVIFAPVAGAFFHPFQSGPADLWSGSFVSRRQALLNLAFEALERGDHSDFILSRFRVKRGTHNRFVFWNGLTHELLELALHCMPATHLRLIFQRMFADLDQNSSGFPDLVQFYPEQRSYRLIEVKGPGDRLQDHQRRWMQFFLAHEIPAAVCHVQRAQAAA